MDVLLLFKIIEDIKFNRLCKTQITNLKICKESNNNSVEINKCHEEKRKLFDCAAQTICPKEYLYAKLVCNNKSYKDNKCIEAIEKVKLCIHHSEIKIKK
jgi:hypothetical protein